MSKEGMQKVVRNRFRYVILILGCVCLTSIASNVSIYNMTRLCMNGVGNESEHRGFRVDYTEQQHNSLVMAAAFGTIVAMFPFSFLYSQYGARLVFLNAGLNSALFTALLPLAVRSGMLFVFAARFMQGVSFASDFALMGLLCSRWASLKQTAFAISLLTCYNSFSNLISSPIAGKLCASSLGWESVFYLHAGVCFLLMLLWACLYTDRPAANRLVSAVELEKIHRGKSSAHVNFDSYVPYGALFRDKFIWIILFNGFTDIFSGIFLVTYQPVYTKNVLHFDVQQTGFLHMAGPIFHIPLKLLFGFGSDKIKSIPEKTKMRVCNTIAVFLPGFSYLALAFIPSDLPFLHIAQFSIVGITFAAAGGGFYKAASLYSRQFAHVIIAGLQFSKAATLFLGPLLMNIFVKDVGDHSQWSTIFVLLAVSVFVANGFFCWAVTDQPADFTNVERTKNRKNETRM